MIKYTVKTVKQYNSTYKHILFINGEPIAITESRERMSKLLSYVQGYDIVVNDFKIKKVLDKYREVIAK